MTRDVFHDKARGELEQYSRHHDELLIQKLRERAHVDELTRALAEKLEVDDRGLLERIVALGVTLETGSAFLLAPLVQIAWAEGEVTPEERDTILAIARERGIDDDSPSQTQLLQWLQSRPPDDLFETAEAAIRTGISVLPEAERVSRIATMVGLCRRVAAASGGGVLARLLGLDHSVSQQEEEVLAAITAKLEG
jgi:tellurite resistance protein